MPAADPRVEQQPDGSYRQTDPGPMPRAEISPAVMKGEPKTDKRFTVKGGDDVRVRIVPTDFRLPGYLAPTSHGFKATVALLDKKGKVQTNAAGEAMILAEHDFTYDTAALARLASSGRTIEQDILETIAELAHRANAAAQGVADLESTMADWSE